MILTKTSKITIVIPEKATSREIFAAEELSRYLQQILSDIKTCVINDCCAVSGNKILIGGPERNRSTAEYLSEEAFDALVPGPEGIMLRTVDENTLICAGSSKNSNEKERGTLYAAYELLERFLGCSLAAYVNPDIAGGEYILWKHPLGNGLMPSANSHL